MWRGLGGLDMDNIAFIDGQNLHLGSKENPIDYKKFRVYLTEKYSVKEAYYYFGHIQEKNQNIYDNRQKEGYILRFKEHGKEYKSQKKGNVDTDIVFDIMKELGERDETFEKIVLVCGEGVEG